MDWAILSTEQKSYQQDPKRICGLVDETCAKGVFETKDLPDQCSSFIVKVQAPSRL